MGKGDRAAGQVDEIRRQIFRGAPDAAKPLFLSGAGSCRPEGFPCRRSRSAHFMESCVGTARIWVGIEHFP